MEVVYFILVIASLIIISVLIDKIEEFYHFHYNHNVYDIGVIIIMVIVIFTALGFLVSNNFTFRDAGSIISVIIGSLVLLLLLFYNIKSTSVWAGIFLTLFQITISALILIIIVMLLQKRKNGIGER